MKEPQKNSSAQLLVQLLVTTLPCLSGRLESIQFLQFLNLLRLTFLLSTKHTLGMATISRSDHGVAQTRELEYTKVVIPAVTEGLIKF